MPDEPTAPRAIFPAGGPLYVSGGNGVWHELGTTAWTQIGTTSSANTVNFGGAYDYSATGYPRVGPTWANSTSITWTSGVVDLERIYEITTPTPPGQRWPYPDDRTRIEDDWQAMVNQRVNRMVQAEGIPGAHFGGEERAQRQREQAEQRTQARATARALLTSWLSPDQLADYEAGRGIPVVGSQGTRFRLHDGIVANVAIEDESGREVTRVCAHPDDSGGLPTPDAHLGQLLALENDERAFLGIANWSGQRRGYDDAGRLVLTR